MTIIVELIIAGLVIGVFVGMSGVGGGSIMTPVLVLFLGINPLTAVGTDLLYSVPTKIFGTILHARQRTMDWRVVRALLAGGIPGALIGVATLYGVRHFVDVHVLDKIVKHAVGVALIISAGALVYGMLNLKKAAQVEDAQRPIGGRAYALSLAGGIIGFLVTITSIGSGSITMPVLLLLVPFVGLRKLVGSDIAYAACLIPLAAAGHMAMGDVNYRVALLLLCGSLPGVYIGSRLCSKTSEFWLRPAVATILVIAGQRLIG
jgi:uncharacterized membrane protein YfcA